MGVLLLRARVVVRTGKLENLTSSSGRLLSEMFLNSYSTRRTITFPDSTNHDSFEAFLPSSFLKLPSIAECDFRRFSRPTLASLYYLLFSRPFAMLFY